MKTFEAMRLKVQQEAIVVKIFLEQEVVQFAPDQSGENLPDFFSIIFDREESLSGRLGQTPKIRGQGGA